MDSEINHYPIGELLNPLQKELFGIALQGRRCQITVPARVDTFLCHHNYFVSPPRPQVYPVGSINFSIQRFTEADVSIRDDKKLIIDAFQKHQAIIEHTVKIMQKTLHIETGFNIRARNRHQISHGGLGSSAAVMSAVAQAINILFGSVLSTEDMTKLLAQNYGEETPKKGFLSPMASIGGATAVALSGKSLMIIGGEADIWCADQMPKGYCAIMLYPKNIQEISGVTDFTLYKQGSALFKKMGEDWGNIKEHISKTKIIPGIRSGSYSELFRSINMYTVGAYGDIPQYFQSRWVSHNVFFDSFIYSIFSRLFGSLKVTEHCFFVSSGGPLIVVITKQYKESIRLLGDLNENFLMEKVSLCRSSPSVRLTK